MRSERRARRTSASPATTCSAPSRSSSLPATTAVPAWMTAAPSRWRPKVAQLRWLARGRLTLAPSPPTSALPPCPSLIAALANLPQCATAPPGAPARCSVWPSAHLLCLQSLHRAAPPRGVPRRRRRSRLGAAAAPLPLAVSSSTSLAPAAPREDVGHTPQVLSLPQLRTRARPLPQHLADDALSCSRAPAAQ